MIENLQATFHAVLRFIRVELKSRIGHFLERAKLALRERPYTTFSARQQGRTAERWLVDNQPALETALHRRITESFSGEQAQKEISYDELQLLDDDSLNVVMLRARLVSSVMERARESVVALEVRLEALKLAGAKINPRAFTPGAIADGFMDTLEQLAVPIEAQILLMEAYSERGAEMLTAFYKDLNALLVSHGVYPDFKYSVARSPSGKDGKEGKDKYASQGGTGPGSGAATASGTSGSGSAGSGGKPGEPGMDMAPAWPTVPAGALPAHFAQVLDEKLSSMQAALAHLTAETWTQGTLRDTFKLPPPISLNPEQEESIDHIEAVFLDLIRDKRISARFRSELNRLILPLMSLRLTDAELFKDPENPVRRFIRQLALLGFRDLETPIHEFEHIGLIVGRIVSERGQEIASFQSGADALYTIARNEVRMQLEYWHGRGGRSADGEDKPVITDQLVATSQHFVRAVLKEKSAGLHLPSVVQHFVLRMLAPWMMGLYQENGIDSELMKSCLAEADTFFTLLEPAVSDDDHKEKIQLRQRTLEQMAFRAIRAHMPEEEMRLLLEGMAEHYEILNKDPDAGLIRKTYSEDESFVSYLDDMPATRAS